MSIAERQISLWRSRPFTLLLSSVLLLTVGNKMYEIVLPLMMYDITHSSVSVASMRTAELLPNFLFAVLIGVLVDRVNKKKWVMWMVGSQALLLFIFGYLFQMNIHILIVYYALGFLLMTFNYGFFNAQVSMVKLSVAPSQLTSANAKFAFMDTLISIMGPAFSGILLLFTNMAYGIWTTAGCYILSLIILNRLPFESERPAHGNETSFVQAFREGFVHFFSQKLLLLVTVFVMLFNCTTTVVGTTIIFLAKDVLHLQSSMLAAILSMTGLGGLLGSLLISKLRSRLGLGKIFGLSTLLCGLSYALFFLTHNLATFIFALFMYGLAGALYNISVYTFRQEQSPARLMGRIAGITGMLFRTGMPIAVFASGWIVLWWGTYSIFLISAVFNITLFGIYMFTRLWKIS
ncbi:MFS transporter [Paenibacillus sediminis]|uniref:MFS family permease n=1 Tax=Paenibacillus sediminis TaxID=664909 RepID=A0ABS4H599_9BACL|nr:MFS transporter [Paenibacillus sediminis]MBP1937709.1 MFS family permease [Paenibacillus sediminis]